MSLFETVPLSPLPANDWRLSRWLILLEFILIDLIFLAGSRRLLPLGVTPYLVLLAWVSLRLRGLRWRDLGLARKSSWTHVLTLGMAAGVGMATFDAFVVTPLLGSLTGRPPDLSAFRSVPGSLGHLLFELAIVWTFAAFGEEMIWRGYLLNRLAGSAKPTRNVWIASLIAVNVAFGLAHSYQGLSGMIDAGLGGLFLGMLYLYTGRNLLVPIVAHGVFDTVGFVAMYLHKYPGM